MTSLFQEHSQYYKSGESEQKHNQIVDIDGWSLSGDFDPYAEGARSKFTLHCPSKIEYPFLIPSHRYLYKKTFERKGPTPEQKVIFYEQFWVEIIAYRLGRFLGVEVPPTFVACRMLPNGGELEYAALIEWYYDYPGSPHASVDRGGGFMSFLIPNYDRNKGRQHNFKSIETTFKVLKIREWQAKWSKILLFDALTGNTDRHQENWEVVSYFEASGANCEDISPAFDNGTAMGYEIAPAKIPHKIANIDQYIMKGTHQMRWDVNDTSQQGHFELIERLISTYPQAKPAMAEILSHDLTSVCNDIRGFCKFDVKNPNYRLSPERAEFIIALLLARYAKAKEIVGL